MHARGGGAANNSLKTHSPKAICVCSTKILFLLAMGPISEKIFEHRIILLIYRSWHLLNWFLVTIHFKVKYPKFLRQTHLA